MFCPYCGSELECVGGELVCRRGGMELSLHLEERLCAAFVHGTDEPSRSPVRYRVGGRWYCPGCGVPAVTGEHSVACSRCGKHLTPFLVELVELPRTVGPSMGEPRGGVAMVATARLVPAALALAATALGAVLLACSRSSAPGLPADGPYVRGPVESIRSHATATGLLVRAGPGSREPCGIQATADARTRYLRRMGPGELRPAALSDLEVGDTVEVYVEGPVAESCPVQGRAAVVVLVPKTAR